jgi:hypothetical protein
MDALRRALEKKELSQRREVIRQLYEQYLGPYNLYHFATIDEVMMGLQSYPEDQRLDRLAMLAELYYAEAETEATAEECEIMLQKAFNLFDYIERNGSVFSIERREKMALLLKALGK